jgi:hypothetical protein
MSEPAKQFQERRVAVRTASSQEAPCHFATLEKLECRWGKVRDLSKKGISLLLQEPMEMGQLLFVELPSKTPAASAISARVVYALDQSDGTWLVGCIFDRPLGDQEYQTLL